MWVGFWCIKERIYNAESPIKETQVLILTGRSSIAATDNHQCVA